MNLQNSRATALWEVAENEKNSEVLNKYCLRESFLWKNSEILNSLLEQPILLYPSTKILGIIYSSY